MEIFQAIIMGVIQGLTEFLPVSSTAHLILVPKFFQFADPGLSFDVALHCGTLLAIVLYFYRDWILIIKLALFKNFQFPPPRRTNFQTNSNDQSASRRTNFQNIYTRQTLWLLVIATIPGVLAGYFLEAKAETVFRSPWVIAIALVIGGLILYLADKFLRHDKNINNLKLKDSILIGLLQAVAIIPGVSRSGATIVGGLWRGLDREGAARFSFLLSTPVIFGAVVFQFSDFLQGGINLPVILGILASAISGFLAIKYFLKLIHRVGYGIFFWYRLFLAVVIVIRLV